MRLTIIVKLMPTSEQVKALLSTLEQANAAANALSRVAWDTQTFARYKLHKLAYTSTRAASGLGAQIVVRLLAKVADAYKTDRRHQRIFQEHGSIAYDDRILHWYTDKSTVSIWTVDGRLAIPFVCGERQRTSLVSRQGETDLVYRNGEWYLHTIVNYFEPSAREPDDYLGIDLGIVNLAVDSDGTMYSGEQVEQKRRTYAHRRRNLQRKRTRAARRKLKRLSGKQARYQKHINHTISKRVVAHAQGTQRGIALEDLKGLRARTTVKKRQRARHANWSYHQLGTYIRYKAQVAGVFVVLVDPRHTSQLCHICGHCDKANRQSQSLFLCRSCGYSGAADDNAARNLRVRARAAVNQPMFSWPAWAGA